MTTAEHRSVVRLPGRLERLLDATLERQRVRQVPDGDTLFSPGALEGPRKSALLFVVTQLAHIENMSPRNLAQLARCVPVAPVRACFAAQILDEIAHGAMLDDWLARSGGGGPAHPVARLSVWAGERVQTNPWLGVAQVTLLIEFYASVFLDELGTRSDEPYLRALIEHIQKDESRHKAIAVEALVALREAGLDKGALTRALGPLVERSTLWFFRDVFGRSLDKHAGALDLPHTQILERALDEAHSALTRAMNA